MPEQEIEPLQWMVRAFYLIHSEQGFSKHNELRRWPLLPGFLRTNTVHVTKDVAASGV